ncbi:hypothetical protein APR41_07330 [Salegentibacter salinarum]|uniref:Uncharacterized protein n=1 Tax=Salegentibacter salinarum TaxID=447422 RepID=A0A2N0TPF6_9FLAO|nr:hypothetical protein [Salegentibacter salinarum]PKD16614.1 hypothetical protein APR41_07330 [Salegentibacter salinarum]SKB61966.1 hypothetical protein SAMN05660903_01729 [Salegentibacter salinarum]
MLQRFILFIGIILFTFSCGEDDSGECNGICTEEFKSINVEITDSEENPVVLDSTSLTDITNNREVDLNSTGDIENGFYTIFNDNLLPEYKNEEIDLLFKGFQEENLIVEQEYRIGADCCHVYPISGPLVIQLE